MRTCRTCKTEYTPSSGHVNCPSCRYESYKTPCKDCGTPCGKRYKLCLKCLGVRQSGEYNPNWRGGKTKSHKGYIQIHTPDHPRTLTQSNQYVFEHILVMEESLGRYLRPEENVHHLNGIKDDNRIENLELWTKPQPSGIRASDALAWAYQIIELYGVEVRAIEARSYQP